jgi:hypothetical protein
VAFLYNKTSRKILLTLIIIWSLASFWLLNLTFSIKIAIIILGLLSLLFVWLETAAIFLLIFLSFVVAYAFYGFLFQYNLPVWMIMSGILVIFGYIFLYTEQRIGILGNKRLIYLILFGLITLEVFLMLSYFLISPLSKSIIIAITSYLFVGFSYTVLARHEDNKMSTYIFVALLVILTVFLSSSWGGLV